MGIEPCDAAQTDGEAVYLVDGKSFRFEATGFESEILRRAFERYQDLLFPEADDDEDDGLAANATAADEADALGRRQRRVRRLKVHVALNDQSLNLQTDESYVLDVSAPSSSLSANTVFGALHGLETFSQLLDAVAPEAVQTAVGDAPDSAAAMTDHAPQAATPSAAGLEASREAGEAEEPADCNGNPEAEEEEERDGDEGEENKKKHKKKHKKHKKKHHKKHKKHHEKERTGSFSVRGTYIWDAPRFQHRGLLIDTARHFLPLDVILEHLDAMAWAKLNVLHWHIVDDQSFPFVSAALPGLAAAGAFAPDLVYTPQDVQAVVWAARLRGIRVVPEFDTPGHTLSWGAGYPHLLADCYDEKGRATGAKGPLNPARNSTYEMLWALLQALFLPAFFLHSEVASAFPDGYLHLGGDEVPFECWLNNPEIADWMSRQDPVLRSMPALEEYFETHVLELAAAAGRSYIVWQDVLDNKVTVAKDTIVHVWKWWWPVAADEPAYESSADESSADESANESADATWRWTLRGALRPLLSRLWPQTSASDALTASAARRALQQPQPPNQKEQQQQQQQQQAGNCSLSLGCAPPPQALAGSPPGWVPEMERITLRGYRTLLSSPWYLNLGDFASGDWARYYSVEPLAFRGTPAQKRLVVGGEVCMWGEFVDATNSVSRTWPRAAAVAERLWSDAAVRDVEAARPRLEEHRCRMRARGIAAEPLGPGFCPGETA